MTTPNPTRAARLFLKLFAVILLATLSLSARAQSPDDADPKPGSGHILLVLPFDNQSAPSPSQSTLDWLREAAPEILNSRFTSAGFFPLTREDRLYALDHLGLPENFQPSRATALRIAQTLDADSILIGSYAVSGTKLTLKARIVEVAKLRISDEISTTGEISQLVPLLNSLAWQLTRKLDPTFSVAEETFRSADAKLRLDAFEQYIRGITTADPAERLRHLKKATDLSPDFTAAWLATGKTQFATQQYEQAAVSFAKVTGKSSGDPAELEAGFYRGLALIFSGSYSRAEEAFANVARLLPLPEVVNNQAVAISRRNRDSVALFRQAVAADPTDADYHFNLAVALHRHGDKAEALTEIAQSLKLRPADSEAKAAETAWKSAPDNAPAVVPASLATPASEPLERIKRSYNGAAFRQAALMMDQVEAAHLATLPAPERAARLSRSAREKLDHGLLLEAERGYQAALTADDHSAVAHAGLAQVRERAGDADGARKEARAALDFKAAGPQNVEAYLVLARLDIAANNLPQARQSIEEAIRQDPNSKAAKDLRKTLDTRLDTRSDTRSDTRPEPKPAIPTPALPKP